MAVAPVSMDRSANAGAGPRRASGAAASPLQRVLILRRFGGPEGFELVQPPLPSAGEGEVRVRVLAASVQFTDLLLRKGKYPDLKEKPPLVLGYDVVGEVDQVGPGVTDLKVGDRVADLTVTGSYALFRTLRADRVVRVPPHVDPAEATALVLTWATAYQLLHRAALVKPGERVLVVGAAGAVGQALLSLGRLAGLEMWGATRPAHFESRAVPGRLCRGPWRQRGAGARFPRFRRGVRWNRRARVCSLLDLRQDRRPSHRLRVHIPGAQGREHASRGLLALAPSPVEFVAEREDCAILFDHRVAQAAPRLVSSRPAEALRAPLAGDDPPAHRREDRARWCCRGPPAHRGGWIGRQDHHLPVTRVAPPLASPTRWSATSPSFLIGAALAAVMLFLGVRGLLARASSLRIAAKTRSLWSRGHGQSTMGFAVPSGAPMRERARPMLHTATAGNPSSFICKQGSSRVHVGRSPATPPETSSSIPRPGSSSCRTATLREAPRRPPPDRFAKDERSTMDARRSEVERVGPVDADPWPWSLNVQSPSPARTRNLAGTRRPRFHRWVCRVGRSNATTRSYRPHGFGCVQPLGQRRISVPFADTSRSTSAGAPSAILQAR